MRSAQAAVTLTFFHTAAFTAVVAAVQTKSAPALSALVPIGADLEFVKCDRDGEGGVEAARIVDRRPHVGGR